MENRTENMITINNLPSEIISMILKYNSSNEIVYFGSTCKRFYEVINTDQFLWKLKLSQQLSPDIYNVVEQHCNGDWFAEIKLFCNLRQNIYKELASMSPKLYWQNDITYEDMRNFFSIALTNNMSYYYTICLLQNIVKKCRQCANEQRCKKPYTLTEAYYARVALRHLLHTYLTIKWVREHKKDKLTPENVINFFVQWVDTDIMHLDESVEYKLKEAVHMVEANLGLHQPGAPSSPHEPISERKILAAISHVLYRQRQMAVTTTANLDTLDIVRVLSTNCGSALVLAAVYHSIARRLGVKCELVVFPNHLFLEWRDTSYPQRPIAYTIDLGTGQLNPKRQCPFSRNQDAISNYKYYPDSLLQYVYSSFHINIGAIKNWNSQNALHLLDFLGTYDNDYNPYRHFLPYLFDLNMPKMDVPLNIRYFDDTHLQLLSSLAYLNAPCQVTSKPFIVKKRDSRIKFAVGMVCYHRKYEYTCIIRGWDLTCAIEWQRRMEIEALDFGPKQPFYHVLAVDQSQRYVAQENLVEKTGPTRLFYLEDFISREFSHFDGFSYVPNEQKKIEYPDEENIVQFYRSRCELRTHSA